jgi:ring-1,2-phenylacetyl-CoA epoxidase subunit PaaC
LISTMTTPFDNLDHPFNQLLLAVADAKLMLGHRNADWTGLGPILEEDIAFSSLAQDEIAHASALYELVGRRTGRAGDDLAFGRAPAEYRSAAIVELPDEFDWATAIARQFFCEHLDLLRLERLARSSDRDVAGLARRLHDEERIHVEHVDAWIRRLGRGTADSRRRLQEAITAMSEPAAMLPEPVDGQEQLERSGLYPPGDGDLFETWYDALAAVTGPAGLTLELRPPPAGTPGGRRGHHSPHRPVLLEEMCQIYRLEPGAAW